MRLTDEQISEFQRLYKNRFGEDVSREEAIAQGLDLISLMRAVYRPIKKSEVDELAKIKN